MKAIRAPGPGLTRRLLFAYAASDVLFKLLTFVPFAVVLGILGTRNRLAAAFWLALLAMPGFLCFRRQAVRILVEVERWYSVPLPGVVRQVASARAAEAAAGAPIRIALAWAWYWLWPNAVFAALATRGWALGVGPVDPRAASAAAFLVAAFVTGSLAFGFNLGSWFLVDTTDELSQAAADTPPAPGLRFVPLRARLAGVAFCIVMAPSFWFTALAVATEQHHTPGPLPAEFVSLIAAFLLVAAAFGPLVAWLLAAALADPLSRMTSVISRIADEGEWSVVGRVPAPRRDEIGELGTHLNRMIERLERLWHEREVLEGSLAAMNRQLEAIVRERTESLEATNERLVQLMADRDRIEVELRLAQKLEAVGQLAAGVAHEINTPVQFVGDSVQYVRDAMQALAALIARYRELRAEVLAGRPCGELASRIGAAEDEADLDYALENVPIALDRSIEGLGRVATIVRSMKEFAHPDHSEMVPVDLNQAIESTLVIARNEYKYVADVDTDLGDIPAVMCHGGDVNQALLNVIVNAAHAIAEEVGGSERRGRIGVRTRADGDAVWVTISDTGGGIPTDIQDRIFDPFFTTKEVGRGTGQGLAITRAVVCDRHGGDISFETAAGVGTTFRIRLPIHGKPDASATGAP